MTSELWTVPGRMRTVAGDDRRRLDAQLEVAVQVVPRALRQLEADVAQRGRERAAAAPARS